MNVESLRDTVAAHLVSTHAMVAPAPAKNSQNHHHDEGDHADAPPQKRGDKKSNDVTVTNAYFGNLDAGNFVDVTNKIRAILGKTLTHKHCVIRADKAFLECPSSFANTENNKLRIVIDKAGAGRTFTIVEGKEIDLGEALDFHFVQHSGRDAYDAKNEDANADGDFSSGGNPFGGIPKIEAPSGGCGSV